jgi:hypothetical protein
MFKAFKIALSFGQLSAKEIHGEPFPCSLGRVSVALKAKVFGSAHG